MRGMIFRRGRPPDVPKKYAKQRSIGGTACYEWEYRAGI